MTQNKLSDEQMEESVRVALALQQRLGKKVTSPTASNASAAIPAGPERGQAGKRDNHDNSATTTGGGNDGGNASNGGGGSGGGSFWSHNHWSPRFIIGSFISVLAAIGILMIAFRTDPNSQTQADIAASNAEIAKATGAIPQGWTPGNRANSSRGYVAPAQSPAMPTAIREILRPSTFYCGESKKMYSDFASAKAVSVNDGQAMQVGPGCLLTEINTNVTKFDGERYMLLVPLDRNDVSKGFSPCGNGVDGRKDSNETCLGFLNSNQNQPMWLIVFGHLQIN